VESPKQPSLGFIDITAVRNAYGRQKESFETEGEADLGEGMRPIKMVFIRAPRISRVGPGVTPLVTHHGECVMAREGSVLVAAFHPELTDDPTVHRYFGAMVRQAES
jgi:5'-phosphate synthase pdxT subunit